MFLGGGDMDNNELNAFIADVRIEFDESVPFYDRIIIDFLGL